MIEILTERSEWNNIIKTVEHCDFYHTYHYHYLSKGEDETPILIHYEEEGSSIILPLMLRDIEGTSYKDVTSVYGYAGPLCSTKSLNFENTKFKSELKKLFLEQKIVSVFSRLHPYIDHQEEILANIGEISSPGEVVYIDLTLPIDLQRQQYSSRLKTYINKSRKVCSVRKGTSEEDIRTFIDIYYENMRRVNADESYFFNDRYFYQFMLSSFFKTELLLCVIDETNEVIAGAMFIKMDDIVQYHLSGYKEEYLNLNAIKLIIDTMRINATEEGYKYFNLGGGKGVKNDSLFAFKSTFSKNHKPAKFWKYIVNPKVYKDLTEKQKEFLSDSTNDGESNFFPAYRQIPKSH
ncbi:GNAT family N-acetyltransferase [Zobellia nedashkovskayae]|uniref:GNAT family N-acetyltransferase n=1 Tax=Zobellia nedashkovskayae TaxID=2779510 RepID=UPI00188A4078|nr:GNAT family N-acetyltransferase [Zobellia nedashkovskayae]